MTESRQTLNKGGASTHPCLNPTLVPTGAESTPLRMTAEWQVWRTHMFMHVETRLIKVAKLTHSVSLAILVNYILDISNKHVPKGLQVSDSPQLSLSLLCGLLPSTRFCCSAAPACAFCLRIHQAALLDSSLWHAVHLCQYAPGCNVCSHLPFHLVLHLQSFFFAGACAAYPLI
jgi:hypothetical protein